LTRRIAFLAEAPAAEECDAGRESALPAFYPRPPLDWRLRARLAGGILAGGCLRDMLLGRPIKDIDIFVPSKGAFYAENAGHYQIIHKDFNGPLDLLNGFDLGLCQIAFDGRVFIRTPAFLEDVMNKTITVFSVQQEHLTRVHAKYSDFTVIIREDGRVRQSYQAPV
jgi:hypothetical protein